MNLLGSCKGKALRGSHGATVLKHIEAGRHPQHLSVKLVRPWKLQENDFGSVPTRAPAHELCEISVVDQITGLDDSDADIWEHESDI